MELHRVIEILALLYLDVRSTRAPSLGCGVIFGSVGSFCVFIIFVGIRQGLASSCVIMVNELLCRNVQKVEINVLSIEITGFVRC